MSRSEIMELPLDPGADGETIDLIQSLETAHRRGGISKRHPDLLARAAAKLDEYDNYVLRTKALLRKAVKEQKALTDAD